MKTFFHLGKTYSVDSDGFLTDYSQWDEDFAAGMAPRLGIPGGLSEKHWQVIHFIRESFKETGVCPLVYQTCKANGLALKEMRMLFPTGYLRGACKLAGITYKERFVDYYGEKIVGPWAEAASREAGPEKEKIYRVNGRGFLVDPAEWDEEFATERAREMKMPGGLSSSHWKVIKYLRQAYKESGAVPTIYETCEANNIELDELERLFPDGYHRGAVKIAGLRVR